MLTKIENPEIKMVREFRKQYADKWFRYLIVENDEDCLDKPPDEELSVVIYIADTEKELLTLNNADLSYGEYKNWGDYWGIDVNPEPGIQIGGLEVEWFTYTN